MNLHDAYKKVLVANGNSVEKTMAWFNTKIVELNYKSPNELIKEKKTKKLVDYIEKTFIF